MLILWVRGSFRLRVCPVLAHTIPKVRYSEDPLSRGLELQLGLGLGLVGLGLGLVGLELVGFSVWITDTPGGAQVPQ